MEIHGEEIQSDLMGTRRTKVSWILCLPLLGLRGPSDSLFTLISFPYQLP